MSGLRIPSPLDPSVARSAAGEGTVRRLQGAGDDPARLRRAAEAFEAWFLQQMLEEMRASESGQASSAMTTFQGMLDEELAGRAARARGVGLADLLVESLVRRNAATAYAEAAAVSKMPAAPGGFHTRPGTRWPLDVAPEGLKGSSRFGMRDDPFTGERRMHRGLDLGAPEGAPIHPIAPGTVVEAGPRGGFGRLVVVDHGGGVRSYYAHASELLVRPGDRVGPDDVLARVGSTGRSTGPHLHLEVRVDGEAVDPLEWLGVVEGGR